MAKRITIPKEMGEKGDLVVISRDEYEALLTWREFPKRARMSSSEKKEYQDARKEYNAGEYVSLKEAAHELGSSHKKKSS